ncbi:hypothetical protein SAMN05421778_101324 [Sphaerotilus natans]|nr:hypothetical protein [Sphaerotilus natans]SIQ08898.1 hypothetical protein SAMN05421778_101324 [Sphaerotilus natans]
MSIAAMTASATPNKLGRLAEELNRMASRMSTVAGVPVEVTIRAEGCFTFSTAARNDEAGNRLATFFSGSECSVDVVHDDECGTFVYVDMKAAAA